MADNIIAPGLGTVLATDEISGAHYSKSKISFGENGTAIDVTEDTPFPVADPAIVSAVEALLAAINAAAAGTQPVSAASLPLPVGASTATKQDEIKAEVASLSAAKRWFAITPADSNLAVVPDCVYVGVAGTVIARGDDSTDATFTAMDGQVLPIRPTQIRTGGTATGLIGLVN